MKVIICPDSFKGTLTSKEAADIIEEGVRSCVPNAQVIKIPIADGGEGSLDAFGAETRVCEASDPYFGRLKAPVGFLKGNIAVIESAACAGLTLVGERMNPAATTTFGVGEQIKYALDAKAKSVIICLGGSATNDAGCGMASALGVRFYDKHGREFIPTGISLSKIEKIDMSCADKRLRNTKISAMCDVKNTLFGKSGAAYIYAPQKGADRDMVKLLDEGLMHFAEVCKRETGCDVASLEGSGAAGGMGAGVVAFLGGTLKSGIETVLETARFDELLSDADIVITGEGSFDKQSLDGKVVYGIASHMKKSSAKLLVVAGKVTADISLLGRVDGVFSIQTEPRLFEDAVKYTKRNLLFTVQNIMRLFN